MKNLIFIFALTLMAVAPAEARKIDVKKDFDSLGGNEELAERAKSLDPENRVQVVQRRSVDRNMRLELGLNYGLVGGGDAYYNTQNFGGHLEFHFTPKFSVGARYYTSENNLTSEGKRVFDEAERRRQMRLDYTGIDLDAPIQTTMGVLTWYPIYGKLNFFNLGVTQFDLYTMAGYGRVELQSGSTDTFAGGVGAGIWLTQWLALRQEVRYQTYQDQMNRRLDLVVATASLGLLL